MSENLTPSTEYSLDPQEKERLERFIREQKAYREAHAEWLLSPKLLGITAAGVLVAVDNSAYNASLSYTQPSWVIWMGDLHEPELPKPAPIFSALTDMDRNNQGTVGVPKESAFNAEEIKRNAVTLRELEQGGQGFPGMADGYVEFCKRNAQYGQLFLPSVFAAQAAERPPRLEGEHILPIAGHTFYIRTSGN